MNIQGWFPLGLTGWISLLSKGLSRVFSNTTVQKHHSLALGFLYSLTLTSVHDYWKNHNFDYTDLCWRSDGSAFFFRFYLFIYFTMLYWFCRTLTWILHGCTCVPHSEPPSHLPPDPIPLNHPSAPALSTLYHASNLDWWFISHMIIYMFQCHSLLFNMLSRLVITFLLRSKRLLIAWLQSPSSVILVPKKIKSVTVSIVSHLFPMKWWAWMPWSLFSECWVLSQLFHSPLHLH